MNEWMMKVATEKHLHLNSKHYTARQKDGTKDTKY